jgi:hypothetical protein
VLRGPCPGCRQYSICESPLAGNSSMSNCISSELCRHGGAYTIDAPSSSIAAPPVLMAPNPVRAGRRSRPGVQ